MTSTKNVFVKLPQASRTKVLILDERLSFNELKSKLYEISGIPEKHQKILVNGKAVSKSFLSTNLANNTTIEILLGLNGGKGGFGSLLRNQAITRRGTTNTDACRDLTGRRLRNVKYEKKLLEELEKKSQEEKVIKRELEEFKKKESMIKHSQYDIKLNQDYKNNIEKWDKSMSGSILRGIGKKQEKNGTKRGAEETLEEVANEIVDFRVPRKKISKNNENQVSIDKRETVPLGENSEIILENKKLVNSEESEANTAATNSIIIEKEVEQSIPEESSNLKISERKEISNGKEEGNSHSEEKNGATTIKSNFGNEELITQGNEDKKKSPEFPDIDLRSLNKIEELEALGGDHIKHVLAKLGLKSGGSVAERAKRLWDIKLNPSNLFNPKYLVKK